MRYLKYLLFILVLLLASNVAAEPRKCVDTLAGALYPEAVRSIPNEVQVGFFAQAFTDALPTVKAELAAGRSYVRIHLIWSDTHSFSNKDLAFVASESKRYEPVCAQYPGRVLISPLTEHNIPNPEPFLMAVLTNAPSCVVVNNPWKGGYTKNPAFINEVHGDHSVPNIPGVRIGFSDDGTNSENTNFTATKNKWRNAEYVCAWGPGENLQYSSAVSADRAQRIKEAKDRSPTKDYLSSQIYLFSDRGNTSIPGKWLVKSHSENHGPGDAKGNKLLIISPVRASSIILKRGGQKICELSYYGSYLAGGFRYYAKTMGYKCGANLDVFIGNKKYGTINGGFRDGSYR